MSETRFTPGPWKISRSSNSDFVKIDGEGWTQLGTVAVRMSYSPFDHPEGVANAQLMVSSPCMYEALEEARHAIRHEVCEGQDRANECWAVLSRIDEALAKARGES